MNPQEQSLFGEISVQQRPGFDHSGERDEFGKDEWLTPPEIIKACGEFDLDPCSPITQPWDTAKKHLNVYDDGLKTPWGGPSIRVWMNPPYGPFTPKWMKKLAEHGNGIALVYARTETKTFFPWVWDYADGIFFFDHRLWFHHVNGKRAETGSGAPSCLVAFGEKNVKAIAAGIAAATLEGKLIHL